MLTTYPVFTGTFIFLHLIGILCAAMAIFRSRTPQGATAWVVSLLTFPLFAVPLFAVFGRSKFEGYNAKRRIYDAEVHKNFEALKTLDRSVLPISEEIKMMNSIIPFNNQPGFTRKNSIKLLLDGQETYLSMLKELKLAQNYIIFQFFIFRYDDIGKVFSDLLIDKSKKGVRVTFLYDEIGGGIPGHHLKELRQAGIKVGSFNKYHGRRRLQINFRNHRKIIVVDGKVGFLGGLNIGDDHLGCWRRLGPWRDTHVKVTGPSVIAAQLAAAKDWYCTQNEIMDADWKIFPDENADSNLLVLHTGPADERNTCLFAHLILINSARERLWIANPYFVPPEALMDAMILAALRGVDVRVLVPSYSDNLSVILASNVYQERLLEHGVKVFKYTKGFMHQKIMLIDNKFVTVGSANLDHRSMFVNFEVTTITNDGPFLNEIEQMLTDDFRVSRVVGLKEYNQQGLLKTIACRGANLLAPIL